MSFLRRLLGGSGRDEEAEPAMPAAAAADAELAYEQELLREEADRLSSDLLQRQLRYADRAWTPPAQGGERRADDVPETT